MFTNATINEKYQIKLYKEWIHSMVSHITNLGVNTELVHVAKWYMDFELLCRLQFHFHTNPLQKNITQLQKQT